MKKVFVFLLVSINLFLGHAVAQGPDTGKLTGKFMIKGGGHMGGGTVSIFKAEKEPLPDPDKYWRVPDYTVVLDSKGGFVIELPEGKYYVMAVKRASDRKEVGPPLAGDFNYSGLDEKGMLKLYIIKKNETTDIGTVREAVPFEGILNKNNITGIEGKIVSSDGKPVEAALVFAYTNKAMLGQPLFVSSRTGKDGKFLLRVKEGGSYYLTAGHAARNPRFKGSYGKEGATSIDVMTGEIAKGVNIIIEELKDDDRPNK